MIHFSTAFCGTPLHSLLSKFLILLCFRNIYSSSSSVHILPEHLYFSFVPRIQSHCWPPTILKQKMWLLLQPISQKSTVLKPPSSTPWHLSSLSRSIKTRSPRSLSWPFKGLIQHLQKKEETNHIRAILSHPLRLTKKCHLRNCIKCSIRPKLIFYFKRSIL